MEKVKDTHFLNKKKQYRFVYKIKRFKTHMNNIQCLYPGKLRKQIRKVEFFHSPHKLFFFCFFLNCV